MSKAGKGHISVLDNRGLLSVETYEHGPMEKDGYYRRLQRKRETERKIAREKHREWLDENGFE